MSNFDSFKINSPALEAMKELQKSSAFAAAMKLQESSAFAAALKMETSGAFAVAREIKSAFELAKMPMNGVATAIAEYHNMIAPISETIKQFYIAYSPIIEATKTFKSICMKDLIVGLQASMPAINAIKSIDFVGYANIIDALPKHNFIKDIAVNGFSIEEAEKLFEDGEISQKDINEEFTNIIEKKKFSPSEKWDEIQKSKWFFAINLLITILMFIGNPLIEYTGDKVRDAIGITQFIEDHNLYGIIDSFFEQFEDDKEFVSEQEAKETVDTTKTGNISKRKREDLLAKIKEIRTFISAAPQDENTANLLSYLSDLEKDVNGKKYGLVFEEHREEIDEVLDTHTPVLTESKDLFIDNGGQMNFLIEGDNLASLKLLEKTHKGKIDLIYIDPPYNTGNNGNILFTPSKSGVLIQPDGSKSKWNVYTKIWLSNREEEGQTPTNFIGKFENRHSAKELKDIGVSFDFAKPTGLISYLFNLTGADKNAVCLDFFAGSGTTGHAVMKLNAEDGGNRKFILCTNNENNICREVTYERIKRVIDKEGYAASLKYFKVDYIPVSERMYYEYADGLLSHIRELVELENGVNFTNNAEIAIVLTEEELEEFVANIEDFSKCRKLYMGHDLLPNEKQEQALSTHEIEVNIIPDYYYRDLQEG